MNFSQWLESKNIDCQRLEPEMHVALLDKYERETKRQSPVAVLVVPVDCSWPSRAHWIPTESAL